MPQDIKLVLRVEGKMQKLISLDNSQLIELLINLSERYGCNNVPEIISELEVGEEFMNLS